MIQRLLLELVEDVAREDVFQCEFSGPLKEPLFHTLLEAGDSVRQHHLVERFHFGLEVEDQVDVRRELLQRPRQSFLLVLGSSKGSGSGGDSPTGDSPRGRYGVSMPG